MQQKSNKKTELWKNQSENIFKQAPLEWAALVEQVTKGFAVFNSF